MTSHSVRASADVLVVGGGLAGSWAAIAARRAGAEVVLAEKGYAGTSGVCATAGPGHWWVPPTPGYREAAIDKRLLSSAGLGDGEWMARILDMTWRTLPALATHYRFSRDQHGQHRYRALRGPEYMRARRQLMDELGVQVMDHSPTLELLLHADRAVAGAVGLNLRSGENWEVRAGAVVLATGGCAFASHLLGAGNNTGDGLLMAAEAGVPLSGMEFSSIYSMAPARGNMTRTMSYAFARYRDGRGCDLEIPPGPGSVAALGVALQAGPVLCNLGRMPDDIRAQLPQISPNVPLAFSRAGIDPFNDWFEITLHGEGTIRGVGGLQIEDENCQTRVRGLFAAGDVASRERVTGAASGGGAVNSSWALSSGQWAGQAAARYRARACTVSRIGEAGIVARRSPGAAVERLQPRDAVDAVRSAMLRPHLQTQNDAAILGDTARDLQSLWQRARGDLNSPIGQSPTARLRNREAASLIAAARWSTAAALARQESRGMHRRRDFPFSDPGPATRIETGGLDAIWTRAVAAREMSLV